MLLKLKPILTVVWWSLLSVWFHLGPAYSANPIYQTFDTPVSKHILTNTTAGKEVLNQITGLSTQHTSGSAYPSFTQRIHWRVNREVRNALASKLQEVEQEFLQFRTQKGLSALIQGDVLFTAEELSYLESAAKKLMDSSMHDLLNKAKTPFATRGKTVKCEPLLMPPAVSGTAAYGDFSVRESRALTGDSSQSLSTNIEIPSATAFPVFTNLKPRIQAYIGFFRALKLTEANLKTLFGFAGNSFTMDDLVILRRYNRMLDGLSFYWETKLMTLALSQERPHLYTVLNEKTAEATEEYMDGKLSRQAYIEIRKKVAQELQLNDVVWQTETKMLEVIERCRDLGGGKIGVHEIRGQIESIEENIQKNRKNSAEATISLGKVETEIRLVEFELDVAESDQVKQNLKQSIKKLNRKKLKHTAEKTSFETQERILLEKLQTQYIEFILNYDVLELFLNLRHGLIKEDTVQAFDMSDVFTVDQTTLNSWEAVYERALKPSINTLALQELKLFLQTRLGKTRSFTRKMNKLTEKYFDKKFTDSNYGQEFQKFSRHIALTTLQRMAAMVGLTAAPSLAYKYADELWNLLFGEDSSQDNNDDDDKDKTNP